MKSFGIRIPSHLNQWVALAGLALVVFGTLGVAPFWPSWMIPAIGAFMGLYVIGDSKNFLIAGLALMGTKWGLNHLPMFGNLIQDFVQNLILLVSPAMLVVAIRSIYHDMRG